MSMKGSMVSCFWFSLCPIELSIECTILEIEMSILKSKLTYYLKLWNTIPERGRLKRILNRRRRQEYCELTS